MLRALSTASRTYTRGVTASSSRQTLRSLTASAPTHQDQVTAGENKIREILTARFNPSVLNVQDVSGGCGSFYAIQLSSKQFKGLSTLKAHRMVNQQLKHVIKDIHGLQLRTMAEQD